MSDHMKADMEEFNKELINCCQNADEIYQRICSQMLPTTDKEEVSEEDLEQVTGGMSEMQALEVVKTAYWDLCVNKKGSTKYSSTQIYEALNRCHAMNRRNRNSFSDIGRITDGLVKALNKKL